MPRGRFSLAVSPSALSPRTPPRVYGRAALPVKALAWAVVFLIRVRNRLIKKEKARLHWHRAKVKVRASVYVNRMHISLRKLYGRKRSSNHLLLFSRAWGERGSTETVKTLTRSEAHDRTVINGTLNPHSYVGRLRDAVFGTVSLLYIFIVPYDVSFGPVHQATWALILELSLDAAFIANIVLSFFTARYLSASDVYVVDRGMIARGNLRRGVVVEAAVSVPWCLIHFFLFDSVGAVDARPLKLLRLLKLFHLKELLRVSTMWQLVTFNIDRRKTLALELVQLVLRLFVVSHLFACLIYGLAFMQDFEEATWATQACETRGLDVEECMRTTPFDYLITLYVSFNVTTAIGFPVSPTTAVDLCLFTVATFVGLANSTLVLAKVLDIFARWSAESSKINRVLEQLHYFLKIRDVSPALRDRALSECLYQFHRHRFMDEDNVLQKLSPHLRLDILRELHAPVLEKVSFLKLADASFHNLVLLRLEQMHARPGEVVCFNGEIGDRMFIVWRGRVEVLIKKASQETEIVVSVLESGSFFGEVALLEKKPRMATIRAVSFCDLYFLRKERWDEIAHLYPAVGRHIAEVGKQREEASKRRSNYR